MILNTLGPLVQTKHYVTETDLLQDAYRLGVNIANSDFTPTFIVGLWRGGSVVGIAVQECLQYLGFPTDHISLRTSYRGLSSYQQMVSNPHEEIRIHGTQYLLETINHNDGLLIVDDVFSSGLTAKTLLDRLRHRLKNNMPEDVRIAVPWYKPNSNQTDITPDFYLNKTDDWLVMPYELSGLTRDDIALNKPWMLPILDSLDA